MAHASSLASLAIAKRRPAPAGACVAACALVAAGAALGQTPVKPPTIYSCRTAQGTQVHDRPVAGCLEQWELNRDGSRRRLVPPMKSDEERAEDDDRQRQDDKRRAEDQVKARQEYMLLTRFPNKERHDAARREALQAIDRAIANSHDRIEQLKKERKPLLEEAEFYPPPRQFPFKLKNALDANDAATEAQLNLIGNQQAERQRIDRTYDVELEKLKELWSRQRRQP